MVSSTCSKPDQQIGSSCESRGLIAYVSVEDYSSESRDLFGQIRRFNLFEELLLSGDILKEVRFCGYIIFMFE